MTENRLLELRNTTYIGRNSSIGEFKVWVDKIEKSVSGLFEVYDQKDKYKISNKDYKEFKEKIPPVGVKEIHNTFIGSILPKMDLVFQIDDVSSYNSVNHYVHMKEKDNKFGREYWIEFYEAVVVETSLKDTFVGRNVTPEDFKIWKSRLFFIYEVEKFVEKSTFEYPEYRELYHIIQDDIMKKEEEESHINSNP